MRERIARYGSGWKSSTLVPWALAEPERVPDSSGPERERVFGGAELALMYSGSFGRAHSLEDLLELMRCLEDEPVKLAFSVKGQRAEALREAAAGRTNVSFVPFAAKDRLEERLASADIHVVSLREEWTGMVIPSKFFGALAAGRPVLFCGSGSSALAGWIRKYGLGWVLETGGAAEIARDLRKVAGDPARIKGLRQQCFDIYHKQFSKDAMQNRWDAELRALLKESIEEQAALDQRL